MIGQGESDICSKPQIAIVGGGIVGVVLALGLAKRNIPVQLYEQAAGFREIGAGIAFSSCARNCMELIDPKVTEALVRCGAVPVSGDESEADYLRWIDGYNQHQPDEPTYQRPLAQIGSAGFRGCRRDNFLEELSKELPSGVIQFGKRLDKLEQDGKDGQMVLRFLDGTVSRADAIIGCDGIKSQIRKHIFGADNEASYPQYTHKVAYRALVPMQKAREVLGDWKAHNFHHHVGPGAHLTHYPVANHTAVNVVVFLSDPTPWPAGHENMVAEDRREKVEEALRAWHPTILNLVRCLPDKLITWALFDLGEFPLPRYNEGRLCLAGDAAHASTPHHGAGACLGIEDALCLTELLSLACKHTQSPTMTYTNGTGEEPSHGHQSRQESYDALEAVFATFDKMRRTRTQWLVNSSRRVCDLYHQVEWADPRRLAKAETCFEEIRDRSYKIWYFDADQMVRKAAEQFEKQYHGGGAPQYA